MARVLYVNLFQADVMLALIRFLAMSLLPALARLELVGDQMHEYLPTLHRAWFELAAQSIRAT